MTDAIMVVVSDLLRRVAQLETRMMVMEQYHVQDDDIDTSDMVIGGCDNYGSIGGQSD